MATICRETEPTLPKGISIDRRVEFTGEFNTQYRSLRDSLLAARRIVIIGETEACVAELQEHDEKFVVDIPSSLSTITRIITPAYVFEGFELESHQTFQGLLIPPFADCDYYGPKRFYDYAPTLDFFIGDKMGRAYSKDLKPVNLPLQIPASMTERYSNRWNIDRILDMRKIPHDFEDQIILEIS